MNGLEVKACVNKHAVNKPHHVYSHHTFCLQLIIILIIKKSIFIYTEKTYLSLLLTYMSWEYLWTSINISTVCLAVNKCSHRQPIFVVSIITSQVDLSSKRVVGSKDAQKWAKAHDLRFVCLWFFKLIMCKSGSIQ